MGKHKSYQRPLAIALSIAMVLGMTPVPASANTLPANSGTEIIAIEQLTEETENQTVPLGTSVGELDLPDTLKVTVLTQASDENPVDYVNTVETDTQANQPDEDTVSLPVTWGAEPEYDGKSAGDYLFKPTLPENYTLADGVVLPVITVTVESTGMMFRTVLQSVYKRTTTLDLTAGSLTYQNSSGTSVTANPQASDITDTGEGWEWYLNANTGLGYPAKTLVLNGIDLTTISTFGIKLPIDSTIILADGRNEINVSHPSVPFYGIMAQGQLTVRGSGELYVTCNGSSPVITGMHVGSLALESGTIYIKVMGNSQDLRIMRSGAFSSGINAYQKDEYGNYSIEATWSSSGFTYNGGSTRATDVKIVNSTVAAPSAAVGNMIVRGTTRMPLSGNASVTITLTNNTFLNVMEDERVSDWFANLPQGLTATVKSVSDSGVTIAFTGTPGETSDEAMKITIPANKLAGGEILSVISNSDTKFAISDPVRRITQLDLTAISISYQNSEGVTVTANPQASDITDTGEDWAWYRNANDALGYPAKTLVLNGIDLYTSDNIGINLSGSSNIMLTDGSENNVYIADGDGASQGISVLGDLTITGDTGSLYVITGDTTDRINRALFVNGKFTISGGTINVESGDALTETYAIYADKLTISDGIIFAKSGSYDSSYGSDGISYAIAGIGTITDTGMVALQKVGGVYTEPAIVNRGRWCYYYIFAQNKTATDLKIMKAKPQVSNTAGTAAVAYSGTPIDLTAVSGLFTVDSNAGAQTYTIEKDSTGAGMITGNMLTVVEAGTFNIGLTTAETITHGAGAKVIATLTVNKGVQAAPVELGKVDVTTQGGSDGKITGLLENTEYEYKKDNGSYIMITADDFGEITGLTAGTYVVRFPEKGMYNASPDSVEVIIGEPGMDATPPTGEITVNSNTWVTFLNKITFGLFFKDAVDVTITASDDSGDMVAVAYHISGRELSAEEVRALTNEDWTKGSSFSINANKKAVIYARLTDAAGNTAYINSNGMVIYTDSAALDTSISYTKGSNTDVNASVQLNGNVIAKIMNGTAVLSAGTDYTVSNGVITFKAAYLESLGADSYTLTVYYNPMYEAYVEEEGNDEPAVTNISLTVSPASAGEILVGGITISGGSTVTTKNGKLQLTAQITPTDATSKEVLWTIQSGSTYADISSSGMLTAKGNGTVTVRAAAQDGSGVFGEFTVSISGQTTDVDNGGGNNGGNTGTGSNGSGVEKITVDVKEGNTDSTVSTITIERTTGTDGKKKDTVTYQKEKAEETVQKLKKEGKDTARIVIPQSKEEIAETQVNIPSEAVKSLSSGEINLRIDTGAAKIDIAADTLKNISQTSGEDLYFRLVPVKDAKQKESVTSHALATAGTINTTANGRLELVGSPVTIETNMPSTQADITLPLIGVKIPSGAAERKALLEQMAVYIEHSDGEKELVQGELVEYGEGVYGIRIHITKFSVFTLVKTDAFLTSSKSELIRVTAPSGAVIKGKKITATAGSERSSVTVKVKVSKKASWKLYSNKACTKELAGGKLKLKTGSNTAYIKVTAENGKTSKVYTLKVTRKAAPKAQNETHVKYETHVKLGLIGSKTYAQRVAKMFEESYDAANVTIKQKGKYYRVTMDFTDKTAADKACKEMIKRDYIVNYYFYKEELL